MFSIKKLALAAGFASLGFALSAQAATISINPNPAEFDAGGTGQVVVTVDYDPAGSDAPGFQTEINFAAASFSSVTAANGSGPGALCGVAPTNDRIRVAGNNPGSPAPAGTYCTITFTVSNNAAGAPDVPLTWATTTLVGDTTGATFTGNPGVVRPRAPAPDSAPTFTGVVTQIPATPAPVIGRASANGTLQFTGAGGEGASANTGSISCTTAAPFSIVSGGTQSNLGNGAAAPVNFNCTAAAASATGSLSCTLNGATPAQTFEVTCPAGTDAPPPPERPEIVPASSHLSQLLLVILLGMFGMGAVYLVRRS